MCRLRGGTGGVARPNLDFLAQFGSPILIAAELRNDGPAMAAAMRDKGIARPTFRDAELRDLISYLRATSQTRSEEPLYVLPGRADEGRRIKAASCATASGARAAEWDVTWLNSSCTGASPSSSRPCGIRPRR